MFDRNKTKVLRQKIKRAFQVLRKDGFLAYGNFLCCQNCGVAEMLDIAEARKRKPLYYVFWSVQDEQAFREYGYIYLAYGMIEYTKDKDTDAAGHKIVARLREQGADVEWDGSVDTRILVKAEGATLPFNHAAQPNTDAVTTIGGGLYNEMIPTSGSKGHCFLNIDYDEMEAETYRAVNLSIDKREERFDTGDPVTDFAAAIARGKELGVDVWLMSSVDHFHFDTCHNRSVKQGGYTLDRATGLLRPALPDEYLEYDEEEGVKVYSPDECRFDEEKETA
jgi:hypothetical protein